MKTTPKLPKNLTGFTLRHERDGNYNSLDLRVMAPARWSSSPEQLVRYHWQSNRATPTAWYGMRFEVEYWSGRFDPSDLLQKAGKVVAGIMGDNHELSRSAVIEKLEASGVRRIAREDRLGSSVYITEDKQLPPEAHRYMDDYNRYQSNGCTVAAVATSPEQAQALLTKQFAERIGQNSYYEDKFLRWVNAGKPVLIDHYSKPADFFSLAGILPETEQQQEAA